MWSRYLRIRERDGVVAVFHELHPDPLYYSHRHWRKILNGDISEHEIINDLKRRKLIIESFNDDETEFEKSVSVLENKLNQTTILYLMTAQGCNLNCGYCPAPKIARKYGYSLLSSKDAIAGVDLWISHLKDIYNPDLNYFVIFYGGEPLLNLDTVKTTLLYLKFKKANGELPLYINFMIATNGVLINDEVIKLCLENEVMVAVGLDGQKDINDKLRYNENGEGTFDEVITAIQKLVKNGIRTFISSTITPFNIEEISMYSSIFSQLGVEKFGFNFLKGKALIDLVGIDNVENYYRKASCGIIENARKQSNFGFEYQMEKKRVAFESKDFYPVDCTCCGNQLVIQPDGQISNCPFYKAFMGHIERISDDFRIWKHPIVKKWRKYLPIYNPGEAKALCGGGCIWSSLEITNGLSVIDNASKIFAEEVLNEFIWS